MTVSSNEPVSKTDIFQSQHTWLPEVPGAGLSFLGNDLEFNSRQSIDRLKPFTWVLFGGRNGEHLQYLTGMTLWVRDFANQRRDQYKNAMLGIEFTYNRPIDGKDSVIMGKRPNLEEDRIVGENKPIRFEMKPEERIVTMKVMYRHEKSSVTWTPFGKLWRHSERRAGEVGGYSVSGLKACVQLDHQRFIDLQNLGRDQPGQNLRVQRRSWGSAPEVEGQAI